jgi:hypothetical protein
VDFFGFTPALLATFDAAMSSDFSIDIGAVLGGRDFVELGKDGPTGEMTKETQDI